MFFGCTGGRGAIGRVNDGIACKNRARPVPLML